MRLPAFRLVCGFAGLCALTLALATPSAALGKTPPAIQTVAIPAGGFLMGDRAGEFDETPHEVTIARPFRISATEITNAQYEQFDPSHRAYRGTHGVSREDDEAVVFVTWQDAVRYCEWLSKTEGKPYRLPTEAEWEYACQAGTNTAYHTGATLPAGDYKHQKAEWDAKPVSLHVGQIPANAWGLHDMHGNVEEWCLDWYGPYATDAQTDPVGPADGEFRVTRGGSHNTEVRHLRSSNRLGTLPEDHHWLIGFRVVQGEMPKTAPLPRSAGPAMWAKDVAQDPHDWAPKQNASEPYFEGPIRFVHIPENADGPLYAKHNHCPDIVACPNGDLLATWYSCNSEAGREMTVVASRLRRGASAWDPASVFYKAPDRNMHATAIWWDGEKTIFHFNGLSIGDGWGSLALLLRTSTDNGATWSAPRWIDREHGRRHMPIAGAFQTARGDIVLPCDAVTGGNGGTAVHISSDGGKTFVDAGKGQPAPKFEAGGRGTSVAGIHAGVVDLADGRLLAFGRGDTIDGHMPHSISSDGGRSWTYAASPFPPISGGQRLVLMRLREGPLLFLSFASGEGLDFTGADRKNFRGTGLFAALSYDDGATWPIRKLLTPGIGQFDGGAWTKTFTTDATHAEPKGYLAATQSPDGVIHLLSSALHYRFNLAWLKKPNDAAKD